MSVCIQEAFCELNWIDCVYIHFLLLSIISYSFLERWVNRGIAMSLCIQEAFCESKSPTERSVVNQKNSKTNLDQGSEESEKSFARNLKTVIANLIGACCINQLLLQRVWEDQRVPILTNPATWTSNTKSTQNWDDSTLPLFPSWIWDWEHCLFLKLNLSWVKRLQGSKREGHV